MLVVLSTLIVGKTFFSEHRGYIICGLVSVITKFSNGFSVQQRDVFNTLLFLDVLRGDDSTGVFSIHNNGSLKMAKEVGDSLSFLRKTEYKALATSAVGTGTAMVGHNRKATKGTVTDENAHPFIVDDRICLVHNGTLWGDHKKHADVDVDSHAIAHLLSQHSIEDAMNKVDGAFALIWYDFQEEKLNFLRNKERPLYWVETDNAWIWASEVAFLEFVETRHDLKFLERPKELPEHMVNTWSLKDKKWEVYHTKLNIKTKTYSSLEYNSDACAYEPYGAYGFGGVEIPRNNHRHPTWVDRAPPRVETIRPLSHFKNIVSGTGLTAINQDEMDLGMQHNELVSVETLWEINQQYHQGTNVICSAFDTACVNGIDTSEGMYLYLQPLDDSDIIVRYKYPIGTITEEKALQFAVHNAIFNCVLDQRAWHKVPGRQDKGGKPLGFVLFNTSKIILQLIQNPGVIENVH